MGLSTGGVNLDVSTIVSQLMGVERQPLDAITAKQKAVNSKISAYGTIKSALSTFQNAVTNLTKETSFQTLKASSSDASVAISAKPNTTPGNYSIEVLQLAQNQKLASKGLASDQQAVGAGTITFDFGVVSGGTKDVDGKYSGSTFTNSGQASKTVTIAPGNTSMASIRDAINSAKMGVSASIVNDGGDTPYRLLLTDEASGKSNSMRISVTGDQGLQDLISHDPASATVAGQAMSETQNAQDALFKVDGVSISKSSNVVTDAIEGATLTLTKKTSASAGIASISITRDTESITKSVTDFVAAYNQINKSLKDISAYNPTTKVAAALNGDATIRGLQAQLRGIMSSKIENGNSAFNTLAQVGVSLQADGTLSANASKLEDALKKDPTSLSGVFSTVGKPTDALVSYLGASKSTTAGTYAVQITQTAKQGTYDGTAPAGLTVTPGSNDALTVKLNGISTNIVLGAGTYTAATLAKEIQSKINGASAFSSLGTSVVVSESAGKITIASKTYGGASNIEVTGGNDPEYFFGAGAASTPGQDVAGTINGKPALGSGKTLTAATEDASDGIRLSISGDIGARGNVSVSKGYATMFDEILGKMLNESGSINARTTGLNDSLKTLSSNSDRINLRLVSLEKQYRAQYTALDAMLGKMNSTSSYLTQQLAAISKNS